MRVCTYVLSAWLLAAVACVNASTEPGESVSGQGIAELRVDASALAVLRPTRVTVEAGGQIQDLVFNPLGDSFDGAVILPGGPTTVIARAFDGDLQIGASSPTPVNVQVGVVTRVLLRIIDQRPETPAFGPIFDSLSFPTTIQAASPATFAIAVVAPANDPVRYRWESDCADATFGSPAAATTSWVKPTPGACAITVIASSNGFSVVKQFNVVVFPEGTQNGAIDVSGTFITAPRLDLVIDSGTCRTDTLGGDSSCPGTFAAPDVVDFSLSTFGWGLSAPGTLSLSDNCGGKFATTFQNSDLQSAIWLPPLAGGLCIITATAVNGDGGVGTLTTAILTRPGTLVGSPAPQISGFISTQGGLCGLVNTEPGAPIDCGVTPIGSGAQLVAFPFTADLFPIDLRLEDDCGGGPPDVFIGRGTLQREWTIAGTPGSICTVTVRATSFQGVEGLAQVTLQLF